ncbi:hypothetical protein OKW34_004016 [Paraburkholderia youngii]
MPVFNRGAHRAEKQHEAVGILVMWAGSLGDEFLRVTADLAHVAHAFENESVVRAFYPQRHAGRPHRVHREAIIEQAIKGPIAHEPLLPR